MNHFRFTKMVAILIGLTAISVSCSGDDNLPDSLMKPGIYAPYEIDWTAAADSASQTFIERFYCSEKRGDSEWVFSYTEYNKDNNSGNCYWQQAHAMAVMVEYYNRIKNSKPEEAATIRTYFKNWYDRKGNNYMSKHPEYGGSTGFGADWTDDVCWITIALLQIYEATGEEIYYETAKKNWEEIIWPRHEINPYGWLPGRLPDTGANECTNGPGCIVACMLTKYERDAGNEKKANEFLEAAYACFEQQHYVMEKDGTLGTVPLSYTQGTCMESGRLLWKLTGDKAYLLKAIQAARGQMTSVRMNTRYKGEMVMRNENTSYNDENNSIFHAILFHWAARMIVDTDIDNHDSRIRGELYKYINRHASYYWTLGIDKNQGRWENSYFSPLCYEPREEGTGGSLGAYTSAAQAIESMCMIKDIKFD